MPVMLLLHCTHCTRVGCANVLDFSWPTDMHSQPNGLLATSLFVLQPHMAAEGACYHHLHSIVLVLQARVRARLAEHHNAQLAATQEQERKERLIAAVRLDLNKRLGLAIRQKNLKKLLQLLDVEIHGGIRFCSNHDLLHALRKAKIKYHPDKISAAAPLLDKVQAEEVSKILNAWDTRELIY